MPSDATILLVDDNLDMLASLRTTLELAGYKPLTATNGVEALDILAAGPVDLIISDIAMPHMNGYQLYQHVRSNPDWSNMLFIFLTARTFDSDICYGKELGVDDYLCKPIQPHSLLASVRGRLTRARQLYGTSPLQRRMAECPRAYGQITIDRAKHRAWHAGQPLSLAAREFTLLDYLLQHPDRVIPTSELILVTHQLKATNDEASDLLRPLVRALRRKLGYPVGEMGCIENVRSVGYRLTMPSE